MPEINQLTGPIGFAGGPQLVGKKTSAVPTGSDFAAGQWGIHEDSDGKLSLVYNDGGTLIGAPMVAVTTQHSRTAEVYLKATGDPETDLANFKAACAALDNAGGGVLVLDGVHQWPELDPDTDAVPYFGIRSSVEVRGLPGAALIGSDEGEYLPQLELGPSPDGLTTGTAISGGITRWTSDFDNPGGLAVGDYVAIWAEDAITEMLFDTTGNAPGELRRVQAIVGSRVVLDAPVCDTYSASPKVKVLTMVDRVWWHDLRIENLQLVATQLTNARFERLTMVNCGNVGIGAFNFGKCYNSRLIDSVIDNHGVPLAIGVTVGMSSNIWIERNNLTGSGHTFTTGRGKTSGGIETGGCRSVVVRGNVINSFRTASGGNQPLDTHYQGYDVWFDHNDVYLSGYQTGGAAYVPTACVRVRCRKVRITGNKFTAVAPLSPDTSSWGIAIDGAGGVVAKGNLYANISGGIEVLDPFGGHTFEDELFDGLSHLAIRVDGDDDQARTRINRCTCRNHNGAGFASEPVAWIWTKNTAKVTITGCDLAKSGNTNSVFADLEGGAENLEDPADGVWLQGNTMTGYGSENDGTDGDAIGVATGNFTDP